MRVKIGVSARHVHVTKDDVKILFGENYKLIKKKDLSQPGQYACCEQVTIKGPKGIIENVRILGPERKQTQVEISKTDTFKLGIDAPVRLSGDLSDAEEITIIGPKGEITKKAAIVAARHVHVSVKEAIKYGLKDKMTVKLVINTQRGGILNNVYVRVSDKYSFEVHLDTDEANALSLKNGDEQELIIE